MVEEGQCPWKGFGIVVPMAAEARSLTSKRLRLGDLVSLSEKGWLFLSGVGSRRAGQGARALVERGAKGLISWGTAGGLGVRLSPGDLILPKSIVGPDQSLYPVHETWHRRLRDRLDGKLRLWEDPIAESPTVLVNSREKAMLFLRTGAAGVDMESAAIARVARDASVPFVALRAIADSAGMTLPSNTRGVFDREGRLGLWGLWMAIATHPQEVHRWARFGWGFHSANQTLKQIARLVGHDLLVPP